MKRSAFWVHTETGFLKSRCDEDFFCKIVWKNLFTNNNGYMWRRKKNPLPAWISTRFRRKPVLDFVFDWKTKKILIGPVFSHPQATVLNIFRTIIPCLTFFNGNRVEQISFFTALLYSPAGSGSKKILAEPVLCFTPVEKNSVHISLRLNLTPVLREWDSKVIHLLNPYSYNVTREWRFIKYENRSFRH